MFLFFAPLPQIWSQLLYQTAFSLTGYDLSLDGTPRPNAVLLITTAFIFNLQFHHNACLWIINYISVSSCFLYQIIYLIIYFKIQTKVLCLGALEEQPVNPGKFLGYCCDAHCHL